MTLPVRMLADAEADVHSAATWYREQRTGLEDDFLRALAESLEKIENDPLRYPVLTGQTQPQLRRLLLRRFPYGIIYQVRDEQVLVVAVAHTSRRPGFWSDRL